MENKLIKMHEIRAHESGYSEKTRHLIGGMYGILAEKFFFEISYYFLNAEWYMPNTQVLLIECANFKEDNYYKYTRIGDGKIIGWLTEVRVHIDEDEFLNKNEDERRLLVWNKIKEGLYKFLDLFPDYPFDRTIIEKVYEKGIVDNFFFKNSNTFESDDKAFKIYTEIQPSSKEWSYRLSVDENGLISKYFIANVETMSWEKRMFWRYPKAKKWIGHKFYLDYNSSSVSSEIIFDADKKKVEIIDKIE